MIQILFIASALVLIVNVLDFIGALRKVKFNYSLSILTLGLNNLVWLYPAITFQVWFWTKHLF